jgi:sulfopyruvate decarboxylase subunit alpha|tara:strand:- start:1667 stop:2155 length:489 start_codon:yes stop_codon:yes gene_type:complete
LTKDFQTNVFNFLLKNGIENYVGVPDSTLKKFIEEGLKKKKIIISTREEEAIGIATGMTLSGSKSLVFMQNAGFANSLSTITSLVQLYKIPLIFLIGWRGYLPDDAPEHTKIGNIQPKLLKILGLSSKVATTKNWKSSCEWALKNNEKGLSCALIIRREFLD